MRQSTFNSFKDLIYEKCGIVLKEGKEAMVTARVSKRMRALKFKTPEKYLDYLNQRGNREEFVELIDAISTNTTSFYREKDHFDRMKEVLDEWVDRGIPRIRIWSAAASTGEEPYTLAITLLEATEGKVRDIKILATDINTEVLAKCKEGIYRADKVDPVPAMLRQKYFDAITVDGEKCFQAKDKLKKVLTFARLNLAKPPFPMTGPFDLIFCRNVMIYFDNAVRNRLLIEAHRMLKPNGYFFTGHAEGLVGLDTPLRRVAPSVYIR